MKVSTAIKILKDKGILWSNYFDLNYIAKTTHNDKIKEACNKIQNFIITGR